MSEETIHIACEKRFARIENTLEDNGSWGMKTKVAKMWDWWNQFQGKQTKLFAINIIALIFSGLSSMAALISVLYLLTGGR